MVLRQWEVKIINVHSLRCRFDLSYFPVLILIKNPHSFQQTKHNHATKYSAFLFLFIGWNVRKTCYYDQCINFWLQHTSFKKARTDDRLLFPTY